MTRKEFLVGSAAFVAMPAFSIVGDAPVGVALIGCGNRGKAALKNMLDAAGIVGKKIQIAAFCDFFPEKAFQAIQEFNATSAKPCIGPNGYKEVMAMPNVQIVLLCAPIGFRPRHLLAAVQAGKHVFAEKAFAVDIDGVKTCIEAGDIAESKGLEIVAGTQRRHQQNYKAQFEFYADNIDKIGQISGGVVRWNTQHRRFFKRFPDEPDAFYLVRNWNNFVQLAGDHVVEQHVHNIDIMRWFVGLADPSYAPLNAVGFGSRLRAQTGNQYDFFSTEFEIAKMKFIHSQCRQIDACTCDVNELFTTTKGWTISAGGCLYDQDGNKMQIPESILAKHQSCNPYIAEHVDLLNAVFKLPNKNGKTEHWNEAKSCAMSTATAILARESAYTGQRVSMSSLMKSNMKMSPSAEDFENGTVKMPEYGDGQFPKPGKDAI